MIIFGSPSENRDFILCDDGNDVVGGWGGNDELFGKGGNDVLLGNHGDDRIYPGVGLDQVWGGFLDGDSGIDTVSYGDRTGGVYVDLAAGYGYQKSLGLADKDTLHGIENATGSEYKDTLIGDAGANWLAGDKSNDNLFGAGGNDSLYGGTGDDGLFGGAGADLLDGESGVDMISYYDSAGRVVVNLAGGFGLFSDAQGDVIANVENVQGSAYDDVLIGDDGANVLSGLQGIDSIYGGGGHDRLEGGQGNDILNGGTGNDVLVGNAGMDTQTGGPGADRFVQLWASDSGLETVDNDVIVDFNRAEGDKIDLSAIDANPNIAGNQAFTFIGENDFSGAPGQLNYDHSDGDTRIWADVDGDGNADFRITLEGIHNPVASDFIL